MDRITQALWHAVSTANFEFVQRAVEGGADINSRSTDSTGKTLLHEAARVGSLRIFSYLMKMGCDPEAARRPGIGKSSGPSPLHYAVRYNKFEIVQFLCQVGCNVNILDDQGHSPLHLAARYFYYDIAKILLEHDADASLITYRGQSVYERVEQTVVENADRKNDFLTLFRRCVQRNTFRLNTMSSQHYYSSVYTDSSERVNITKDNNSSKLDQGFLPHIRSREFFQEPPNAEGKSEFPSVFEYNKPSVSATHSAGASTQNVGNIIGTKSTIRQSKLFRKYESGNDVKSILGHNNLTWDVNRKQGAYNGAVYDAERNG